MEIFNKFFYFFLGLLLCNFLLEIQNNVRALCNFFIGEEVIKECLELSHSIVQEIIASVSKSFLGWKIWKTMKSFQVKLLLD
jgi:hypothetical protein